MVGWSTLIDALVRVEGIAPADSGLLSFGLGPGGIFVERGRICWAAAPGMQRRLHDLLQGYATDRKIDVDFNHIYQRCRASGTLLGQTLVDEGWITPDELEVALRRHSAESLIELCQNGVARNADGESTTWTSRGAKGYEPRFTFRPVDMLLDVASLAVPEVHATARAELDRFRGQGRTGAGFYVDADHVVPVAAFGELTVHDLWSLGRWAHALPLATRELGTTPSLTVASTTAGDTVAVWWRTNMLYVVGGDDRRALSEILTYLGDPP